MGEASELTQDMVRRFIQFNGGKVSNQELVKHFKRQLNDPETKETARILFKDYVNEIAFVEKDGDKKFLVLKAEYRNQSKESCTPASCSEQTQTIPALALASDLSSPKRDDEQVPRSPIDFQSVELTHSQSSPSILQMVDPDEADWRASWSRELPPGEIPQPPPRKKALGKENRGTKIEEKLRQLNEEREASPPKTLQEEEILELSMKSPGLVKERAQKINKMASEVDLSQKSSTNSQQPGHRKRDSRADKGNEDDDSSLVSTLDPRSREWVLKAAKNDYHALVRLLKEEPKLAGFKDIITGFTALHWASKHGNSDTVKLIAGAHRINVNTKSHGGYTALHVAAMFNRKHIMELLIKTYGADANLRDYSGKKPEQYLKDYNLLKTQPTANGQSRTSNKSNAWSGDLGFIRIGSLNSKVKKTAAALTSSGKTRIKSWGSADSISDQLASQLMPPPKYPAKKKKSKKGSLDLATTPEYGVPTKATDSDSDGPPNG